MKQNPLIAKEKLEGDHTWELQTAFARGYIIATHKEKLLPFLEANSEVIIGINSHSIEFSGCKRPQLLALLQLFGGKWNKEIEICRPDKIRYSQKIEDDFIDVYYVIVTDCDPPPSCQIVEEEVEVPAHIERRRRIICPTPDNDETGAVEKKEDEEEWPL